MESVKIVDEHNWVYEVVSKYPNGYSILLQIEGATPYPWIIRTPDGWMLRFRSEAELWQHALEKKLFKKKEGKKKWESQ